MGVFNEIIAGWDFNETIQQCLYESQFPKTEFHLFCFVFYFSRMNFFSRTIEVMLSSRVWVVVLSAK